MSHVSIYSLAMMQANAEGVAEARQRAEALVLSELRRNFVELAERQEDAIGNLRLLLKVSSKAAPGKTGEVEILINTDNTLTIDVNNAPGEACKQLTQPLEIALGSPISVQYKPEYYDYKVRLQENHRDRT
jgi:Protein of unknown function (DUF2997)